jgi:hypothetical protein
LLQDVHISLVQELSGPIQTLKKPEYHPRIVFPRGGYMEVRIEMLAM